MKVQSIFIAFIVFSSKTSLSQQESPEIQLTPKISSFKTPKGHIIKFKKKDSNHFYIQWMNGNILKTLDYEFDLQGADAWLPIFVDESENFLLIKAGCGNPCWIGFFLPLNSNYKYQVIHEYFGYDLKYN